MKNYSFRMGRRVATMMAVIGVSVLAAAAAENVTLVVPFDFTVGATDFQAGGYRVSLDAPSAGMVTIQPEKGGPSAIVLSRPMSGVHALEAPTVMFNVYGEKRFLSRIMTQTGDGRSLAPNAAEIQIARSKDSSKIASVNVEPLPYADR